MKTDLNGHRINVDVNEVDAMATVLTDGRPVVEV
jgi:hypothetical protein